MSVESTPTSPAEGDLVVDEAAELDEALDILYEMFQAGVVKRVIPQTELIDPDPEDLLPQDQWELLKQARDGELFDTDGTPMLARIVWEWDEEFDEQYPRVTVWRADEPF